MADRYWVGGSGTWDNTNTNWSATSGGPSGASRPTLADRVFFDQPGPYTVTSTTGACSELNTTGSNITFNITGAGLTIFTTMKNTVPTTFTGTVAIQFTSGGAVIHTFQTGGSTFACPIVFNTAGAEWRLLGALTTTNAITITAGHLNTTSSAGSSNNSISCSTLTVANAANAILTLNGSTVILTHFTPITIGTLSTINAGTSQINCTSNSGALSFAGANKTYYNVAFTATSTTLNGVAISGQNTFNNLSFVPCTSVGFRVVNFSANQTINGVLSTSGTHGGNRIWFRSETENIQFTLTINGSTSLTDADFRDLIITGTAAPISGTRIGNIGGCSGITFSTPKTVYWNRPFGGNWAGFGDWAMSSGGGVSFDNQPLPQDTAIIDNAGLNSGFNNVVLDGNFVPAFATIDMSSKTNAMTLETGTAVAIMMGDLKLSTSVTMSNTNTLSFRGRKIQTITSAGRTFTQAITIDSLGGSVELADAINIGGNTLTVTNGTFDTKNFNVTAGIISSSNSNVRTINLGSSTVTLTNSIGTTFATPTNLTFNAGTSLIVFSASSTGTQLTGGNLTFYDMSFTGTSTGTTATIAGNNTYRNLSFTAPGTAAVAQYVFSGNSTITGTLTCAGASPICRLFLRSDILGITRTLTVNSLSATDCDFRDITIAGAAAGSSSTRAGNCGGNSGITFPAAKTVYWNLAGTQNWSATGWAPGSGGTPDVNNFPLAQDTAVFNDAGNAGNVSIDGAWNIGTIDMSGKTTSITFSTSTSTPIIYGSITLGSGVTMSGSNTIVFSGRSIQTITSAGKTFTQPITVDNFTGIVQLGDAFLSNAMGLNTINLRSGTFDAVTYNVTAGSFGGNGPSIRTLKMGTGIWTLTGTDPWSTVITSNLRHFPGTATIVLSNSTNAASRTFVGGASLYYNKVTIAGGSATTQSTSFGSTNTFGEIASTKTVAHTITFGTTTPTIGLWSVTGTLGNVVTVTGTSAINLRGARVSGVNYLAMGTTPMSTTNPVEFYAGPNSTGTGAGVILTNAPTPVTRYWRGGTGTWDATTTTNWSVSSGGGGGASVPTSADTVIFNSASNATAYTVTLTATQLRCASISVSGPASGNVTFAGTAPLSVTQAFTMASTGVTRTHTGTLTFSGTGSGKTISAGQALATTSGINFNGIGASWALSAGLTNNSTVSIINGSLDTAGFTLSFTTLTVPTEIWGGTPRTLSLGASTVTSSAANGGINFASSTSTTNPVNFTLNAGTSTITLGNSGALFYHGGKTFHNVALTESSPTSTINLNHSIFTPTFNNFTITTASSTGVKTANLSCNFIINGTFTVNNQNIATRRLLLRSDLIGTPRTITATAVSGLVDIDMRDINCAGAASWTGTRLGDLGGNSGITMSTPKTVYWSLTAGGSWSSTAWAPGSGGTPDINNFPLAQDTAIIENAGLNSSAAITMDASWHIGTINMSTRTNVMTLTLGAQTPLIYGDWLFGTGVFNSSTASITFAGRGTQTITSNGRTFAPSITIDSFNGTVQLADALVNSSTLGLTSGTFNAVTYNVTSTTFSVVSSLNRTISMGSGLWTLTSSGFAWFASALNLTINKGTADIILTDTSTTARTFAGAGFAYNKLTIGGATGISTTSITGNNTFSEIASTKTVANTISLGSTTQRVAAFTAAGTVGNLLTITGTSVTSPANLIYTGASAVNVSNVIPTFVRAYNVFSKWTATNSTNGGSYGWLFMTAVVALLTGQFLALF